jgi:predicted nucleic acid-binding protein
VIGSPRVVIVASVALALILDEPEAPDVSRVLRRWSEEGRSLHVPGHFWLEIINRLRDVPGASGEWILAIVHRLESMGLETVEPTRPLILLTIDRLERHRLTAYDALYLALAETLDARLATFDAALASASGLRAISIDGDHRLHDPDRPYEGSVTWPRYRKVSAYLADLRAEALAARTGGRLSS